MHCAGRVVVRVEEIRVLRNRVAISGHPFLQDKRFKEPGGVGEMPFGRADFRHRLHDAILGREILRQTRGEIADLVEAPEQIFHRRRLIARARLRGRCSIFGGDRGLDQVIPPSCSSSSRRASSI